MSEPLLSVRNLCASYGRAQVLFGVSLDLNPGEVTALVGRNGAGKSTTLKAIIGLVPASAERSRGAMPAVGSSISRRRGAEARAMASSTRLTSP